MESEFFWISIPVCDRRKVYVQYSQYILSVGCSVVVEESGDVAEEEEEEVEVGSVEEDTGTLVEEEEVSADSEAMEGRG